MITAQAPAQSTMVDAQDVADLLGIRRETVVAWVRQGRIPEFIWIGRTLRFPRSVVDDLVSGRLNTTRSAIQ